MCRCAGTLLSTSRTTITASRETCGRLASCCGRCRCLVSWEMNMIKTDKHWILVVIMLEPICDNMTWLNLAQQFEIKIRCKFQKTESEDLEWQNGLKQKVKVCLMDTKCHQVRFGFFFFLQYDSCATMTFSGTLPYPNLESSEAVVYHICIGHKNTNPEGCRPEM